MLPKPVMLLLLVTASCRDPKPEPSPSMPTGSAQPASPAPVADAPAPGNVVQTEMRLLTSILEHTVRGIGSGDVRGIDEKLHALHAAKEATTAAVRSGAYKLPANTENVAAFEAMDEAFHAHLGSLVKASRANDVSAAAEALGNLVRACHGCHAVFRPHGPTP